MNFWIISGLYLGAAGLGVGMMLYGKPSGNSMFDRLYQVICMWLPRTLKRVMLRCCGKRAPEYLDRIWTYLCYTCNPLVQLFYLLIVGGGYIVFVYYGYPHLPNKYVGAEHKYAGFLVFLCCISTWWKACRTDPGMVTPENVDNFLEHYKFDEIIFSAHECETCQLVKPARSKHCSLCNTCVCRFDHHCIWINNCVGVGNHKWFLSFLFFHVVIAFYGAGLVTVIMYEIVARKDLLNAVYVDPVTKEKHKASYLIVFQYLLATDGPMLFIGILCLVMGAVLCGFLLWHLNLVRTGTTTNELSKWSYVKWKLQQEGAEWKAKFGDLNNIYNQGFVKNFREVFFPIDVHSLSDNGTDGKNDKSNGNVHEDNSKKAKGKKGRKHD
eukprot:TRINITY_DN49261_c0_g1_i1.p1 TRINITY_DN49261_c0_g1~~TRINITY_DN49261_c0_g1_i1.p1  ORF type:complete len:382 (+),score=44.97 TRINITY_DN49261_c0_g1_i1:174-1319(+)